MINVNQWTTAEHALSYLAKADQIPHRTEGEAVLLEYVPKDVTRILDLGTGDGRLLALLKTDCPQSTGIALDFSSTIGNGWN
jgi:methylase of polypeptide subunit release factors